jgi:dTDP-4-dehydrorhamnose reductase
MKKYIVITGKGYIGNYLNLFLKNKNDYEIIHISKKDVDYSNPSIFRNFLKELNKVYWVINCSGYTGVPNVDSCEDNKEECYHYNVTVPLYMTKECNTLNIPIIHIGSGCIYTGYDKIYTETDTSTFGSDSIESSFYSKTKDAFEKLSSHLKRYIFRIRIPFNSDLAPKNYLYKLLKYDNLITKQNSVTCVDDLMRFITEFINIPQRPLEGVYNVVNTGSIDASQILDIFRKYGVENKNWKLIPESEANFRVGRSNCILSTKKIECILNPMPHVKDSMELCVENFCKKIKQQDIETSPLLF